MGESSGRKYKLIDSRGDNFGEQVFMVSCFKVSSYMGLKGIFIGGVVGDGRVLYHRGVFKVVNKSDSGPSW